MTYTRDEWEPASQEAAKIPEDKLRGRLIETMIISERRQRLNCLRQNQIAELREKLSNCEEALKHTNGVMRQKINQVAELREKLEASESDERIDFLLRTGNDAIRERDRLRKALEEIRCGDCDLKGPSGQFFCSRTEGDCRMCPACIANEALAQPAEGTK